ncbi:MAG: protein-L-isoaspartate(D-aspartate) O-methyltransferase [Candidatus Omnitrophica bacterium]|nr:protein-L-isoaspartate(D-aspartate) O-methyltransferase [Candidatus Omnitrophota bacterium]
MKANFSELRNKMVEEQLIARGIKDPGTLEVFRKVPRHEFVQKKDLDIAYNDFPLAIGAAQTISQPYMVALMTECLGLSGKEKVLEIGTGSGYQAAILAELAKEVYSIERIPALAENAKKLLARLGYQNIKIKVEDGTAGWTEYAPFEAIIVTAGAPDFPSPLLQQIPLGGKLVIPIGGRFTQTLTVATKHKNGLEIKDICGCVFVPLLGKHAWREKDVG